MQKRSKEEEVKRVQEKKWRDIQLLNDIWSKVVTLILQGVRSVVIYITYCVCCLCLYVLVCIHAACVCMLGVGAGVATDCNDNKYDY